MYRNIKVIAMDLDGTLTQHKTPLSREHRDISDVPDYFNYLYWFQF